MGYRHTRGLSADETVTTAEEATPVAVVVAEETKEEVVAEVKEEEVVEAVKTEEEAVQVPAKKPAAKKKTTSKAKVK